MTGYHKIFANTTYGDHSHHDDGGHTHGVNGFHATFYWIAAVTTIPFSCIGLIMNVFLAFLFVKDKFFHTVSYTLMLVSIISDSISNFAVITNYVYLLGTSFDHSHGVILCKLVNYCLLASYGISILNLSLIGITRYFAIVRPYCLFYRKYRHKIILIAELFICISALSLAIPSLFHVETYHQDAVLCGFIRISKSVSTYLITIVFFLYLLPSIIIGLVYGRIIKHQRKYVRPGQPSNEEQADERIRKRKFIRMLISITLPYILITWPYFVTLAGFSITHRSMRYLLNENNALFVLAFCSLSITSSITVLNPIFLLKFGCCIRGRVVLLLNKMGITAAAIQPEITIVGNKTTISLLEKSKS
ncbi:Prokineticin receptor 2 [Trichoplax sp. H2]|nr:Prokineticin receptor 2 [Trichoplax sp. H2]|eukprot:RDD37252.1 Prokineticin receptor 2 [Trichoplax sp. H2]